MEWVEPGSQMPPVGPAGPHISICQLHLGPSSLSVFSALCLPTVHEAASYREKIMGPVAGFKVTKAGLEPVAHNTS